MAARNHSYFNPAFHHGRVFEMIEFLREGEASGAIPHYDTIAARGMSGAAVAPILAYALNKKLALVRKPEAHSHDSRSFVGDIGDRWIFVDDFISSGETIRQTARALNDAVDHHSGLMGDEEDLEFIGAFLYKGTHEAALDGPLFISAEKLRDHPSSARFI